MKIHYTAPAWHGGFHKFFGNALRSLGNEVFYFDDSGTASQRWSRKIFTRVPRLQYSVDDRFRQRVSRDWLRSILSFSPDLVILEHAPNIIPIAIREIKKDGYKVFYWIDSPSAGSQAKDLLAGMKEVDKVFSIDRSKEWMTNFFPPDTFCFLPLAGDQEVFRPLPDVQKEYDVVYVGSFPPQSGDGVIRAEIIANIPSKYKVAVLGNGINYWFQFYPQLEKRTITPRALPAEKVNEIYNKAKIVLSIHSTFHIESVSARTHEAALAGAFQIVDWRKDLDELYPSGLLPRFKWAREVNNLIDYWISRPEERENIAAEVREHALRHNTWRHRAEKMIGYFHTPSKYLSY